MYLIKLWGSVFAPKHKDKYIDTEYLWALQWVLSKLSVPVILVHGTGNFGHWLVKQYGISEQSYKLWLEVEQELYSTIDVIYSWYTRLTVDTYEMSTINPKQSYIISGGFSHDIRIVSSDVIFSRLLERPTITQAFIFSDVPGVLDTENHTISEIKSPEDVTHFWSKEGDVTGGMQQKILELYKYNGWSGKVVYLADGRELSNVEKLLQDNDGIVTKIYLT